MSMYDSDQFKPGGDAMKADDVIAMFEELNMQGRAMGDIDLTCAGFACWLANAWDSLSKEDIATLTSVGAVLWREGFAKRA